MANRVVLEACVQVLFLYPMFWLIMHVYKLVMHFILNQGLLAHIVLASRVLFIIICKILRICLNLDKMVCTFTRYVKRQVNSYQVWHNVLILNLALH